MTLTKYYLEKKIESSRSILDKIDKVHFRNHTILTPQYNSEMELDNLVSIDLSISNYFIFDTSSLYSEEEDYSVSVAFNIIPYNPIHRFELVLLYDNTRSITQFWDCNGGVVDFPWGEVGFEPYLSDNDTFIIISFINGLGVEQGINENHFIGISSNWEEL